MTTPEYPTLPEPDATTYGLGQVWNRYSMRAYADATDALRHPSDRTQAPARVTDAMVQKLGMTLAKQHAVYLTAGSVRALLVDVLALSQTEQPEALPTVPQTVLTYVHAYGDARADDDGPSAVRLGDLILSLRRWGRDLARAVLALAPADVPEGCTPADARVLREANHALATEMRRADGWISVDDQLPEPDSPVLCHNGQWTGVGAWMSDEHLEEIERWQDESREFIEMIGPRVTHWMPLPHPPGDGLAPVTPSAPADVAQDGDHPPLEPSSVSAQSRALLLNVLWHHQGGSSRAGQPIRRMLGISQHADLTGEQVAEAKRIEKILATPGTESASLGLGTPLTEEQRAWLPFARGLLRQAGELPGEDMDAPVGVSASDFRRAARKGGK